MDQNNVCAGCKFYSGGEREGFCHRYAPKPISLEKTSFEQDYYAKFPIVDSQDWCGEWKDQNEIDLDDFENNPFLLSNKRYQNGKKIIGLLANGKTLLEAANEIGVKTEPTAREILRFYYSYRKTAKERFISRGE